MLLIRESEDLENDVNEKMIICQQIWRLLMEINNYKQNTFNVVAEVFEDVYAIKWNWQEDLNNQKNRKNGFEIKKVKLVSVERGYL